MNKKHIKCVCTVCLVLLLCFGAAFTVCAASSAFTIMPGPDLHFPFLEWLIGLNIPVVSGAAGAIYTFIITILGSLVY